MVEFALISGLLILFLSVSIDFARAIIQHINLSRIAFETARYASTLGGPTAGTCTGTITTTCTGEWRENIRRRMAQLLLRYAPDAPLTVSDFQFRISAVSNPANRAQERITVSVQLPFNPITPGFNYFNQTSQTVVGPSLFDIAP